MLKLDLHRIFEAKCIDDPYGFLRSAGFTVHTSHRLLHNHVGSISYRNLEALRTHLNCTINDLFAWTPDGKKQVAAGHAIHKLQRGARQGNLAQKLKDLPLDQLSKVRSFVDGLEKE